MGNSTTANLKLRMAAISRKGPLDNPLFELHLVWSLAEVAWGKLLTLAWRPGIGSHCHRYTHLELREPHPQDARAPFWEKRDSSQLL